jgi:CheY-like chemotaxis protein
MRVSEKLKQRILSIDDDPGIGDLIIRLFEATGRYSVTVENEPSRAVETARVFRPDLIFLDVNMPGQTGIQVAQKLRSEPWLRFRPIILFTSLPIPAGLRRMSMGDGPTEFLQKGVPLKEIFETADRLLAGTTANLRIAGATPG